jgi:hypothetical protein
LLQSARGAGMLDKVGLLSEVLRETHHGWQFWGVIILKPG